LAVSVPSGQIGRMAAKINGMGVASHIWHFGRLKLGRRKAGLYRRFRLASQRFYWDELVKRLNRLAYLKHVIATSDYLEDEIEEALSIETYQWEKRGVKVNLVMRDVPLPKGEKLYSDSMYGEIPTWETLRHFKKMVEDAEYERDKRKREGREIGVKYFTAVAATLAALASLANLYLSSFKK
jgi:hypothetical protein